MSDTKRHIAIIRTEGLIQSLVTDAVTAVMLFSCIGFSHYMGGGFWDYVCFSMLVFWLGCKLPGDMKLVRKIHSKREAIEWAESLPADHSAPSRQGIWRTPEHVFDEALSRNWRKSIFGGFDHVEEKKAIPFGWREVIEQARDSIGGGSYSENRQHELSIVGPYLDGLADEFEHLQEVCEAVGQLGLPPIHGDVLPQVGDPVLIHLGRSERWVKHTVVGYYVWKDLGGSDSLHRVFVRVKSADGYLNARMLKDIRPIDWKQGKACPT